MQTSDHNRNVRTLGKHAFDGQCAPAVGHVGGAWASQSTFSVGIFEWVPRAGGDGVKRGKVKVRVKGAVCMREAVVAKAQEVTRLLDAGAYRGPRSISV